MDAFIEVQLFIEHKGKLRRKCQRAAWLVRGTGGES
jgi:hypothetical protein